MTTTSFYIDGAWHEAASSERHPVYNPSTEQAFTETAWATADEVGEAVLAARGAFDALSLIHI